METMLLTGKEIDKAAKIIVNGGLVAMPTETVYGLGADAMNAEAVKKIFKAKGRPVDNPLIIHISDIDDIGGLVSDFSGKAKKLAREFWPGPLTLVLPKSSAVPREISPGLKTVAIRMPNHGLALELIRKAGVPIAAPSANLSGSPSPVTAQHVLNDLEGKIDAVIDGGRSDVGLESTVISLAEEVPVLLRPGGVTIEEIEAVIGKIHVSEAVLARLSEDVHAESPGMKYKHYSPRARVKLIKAADDEKYIDYVNNSEEKNTCALCFDEDIVKLQGRTFSMGRKLDYTHQAKTLFDLLRRIDDENIKIVYARCPDPVGVGMAVYNRLIRAAGFEVEELA